MANVAVEGLKDDIVPLICEILEVGNHNVCYRNESPLFRIDVSSIQNITGSKPDITIVCNAKGYLNFLESYSKTTKIPALVLTGGGPDLEEEVKKYVPDVLKVPFFNFKHFYDKVNEVLASKE